MILPPPFDTLIRDYEDALIAGLLVVSILLLLGVVFLMSRLGRLTRLYQRLTRGTSGGNLEEILHDYMGTVEETSTKAASVGDRLERLAETQKRCFQRSGLVRYDAFEEVGGQQSFSLVLIDGESNGLALSGVYSRADVRVYAKALRNGEPSHPLTRE